MLKDRSEEPSGDLESPLQGAWTISICSQVFGKLHAKYPKVQIDLILTSRVTSLVEEQLDIGLRLYTDNMM